MIGLVVVVTAVSVGAALSASSSEGPPEDLRALRAQLREQLEREERAPGSRLGLVRAIRYVDASDDAVPDGAVHGWVDDWIVAEAALLHFAGPRPSVDQTLRARVALAVAQLSESQRAALHDALVDLLLDPMVLGMGEPGEVERLLSNGGASARADAAWRREVSDIAVRQWVETPARVERESRGVRVWLRDGSQLVLPN